MYYVAAGDVRCSSWRWCCSLALCPNGLLMPCADAACVSSIACARLQSRAASTAGRSLSLLPSLYPSRLSRTQQQGMPRIPHLVSFSLPLANLSVCLFVCVPAVFSCFLNAYIKEITANEPRSYLPHDDARQLAYRYRLLAATCSGPRGIEFSSRRGVRIGRILIANHKIYRIYVSNQQRE